MVIAEDGVKRAKADYWPTVDYQMIRENSDEEQYFLGINDSNMMAIMTNVLAPVFRPLFLYMMAVSGKII